MEVTRKAKSATQFCGSAMVNVPIGGRKKKLKHRTARIELAIDSVSPQFAPITSTPIRNAKPAVVALTGSSRKKTNVMDAIKPIAAAIRRILCWGEGDSGMDA